MNEEGIVLDEPSTVATVLKQLANLEIFTEGTYESPKPGNCPFSGLLGQLAFICPGFLQYLQVTVQEYPDEPENPEEVAKATLKT